MNTSTCPEIYAMFDGIAVAVETHGAIRRVIDDETRRAAVVGSEWRLPHKLVRLKCERHRRLRQIEGNFQPAFGPASHAVERDLRRTM